MSAREGFTAEEARRIGEQIGIDWTAAPFDVEQFRRGMDVELEHGLHDSATNVTGDDPVVTGKIALAHLMSEIDQVQATLVALGSHGSSRAAGILLGGVATTLLHAVAML